MALKFGKRSAVNPHAEYKARLVLPSSRDKPVSPVWDCRSSPKFNRVIVSLYYTSIAVSRLFADWIMSSIVNVTDMLLLSFDLRRNFVKFDKFNIKYNNSK